MFKVITFYKYTEIEDPRELMDSLNKRCRKLNLLGRILIACEGINGGVCGESESIEKFKERLKERSEFNDMSFREQEFEKQAYHKLVIRVRDEVVVFDKKVNLENKGNDISSAELKKLLDNIPLGISLSDVNGEMIFYPTGILLVILGLLLDEYSWDKLINKSGLKE